MRLRRAARRLDELSSVVAAPRSPPRAGARTDGRLRRLAVADDQHVRHLLQLGLADLISDLLLPLVELHAEARLAQPAVPDRRA